MIILNLITPKEFEQDVTDCLKSCDDVTSFYIFRVDEYSDQQKNESFISKKDLVEGFTQKIKLEVIIVEERYKEILGTINNITGLEENSYSWITEINNINGFNN